MSQRVADMHQSKVNVTCFVVPGSTDHIRRDIVWSMVFYESQQIQKRVDFLFAHAHAGAGSWRAGSSVLAEETSEGRYDERT